MGRFFDLARLYMSSWPPSENFFCDTAPPISETSSSRLLPAAHPHRTPGVRRQCAGSSRSHATSSSPSARPDAPPSPPTSHRVSQAEVLGTEQADLELPVRRDAETVARAAEVLAHGRDEAHAAPAKHKDRPLTHVSITRVQGDAAALSSHTTTLLLAHELCN